jgi:hypothetical protein
MPERAEGAAVRVTALLDAEARVSAAGRLVLDEVPATVSLWLDVADDAALIALLGGSDHEDAKRLARLLGDSRAPAFLPPRDNLRSEVRGSIVRVVWVLTPRRFEAWTNELRQRMGPAT